jgi:putative transcriptional regulator
MLTLFPDRQLEILNLETFILDKDKNVKYTLHSMQQQPVMNAVRETRVRREITQEQLAELTGLARQSIISIEKGRFLPTIETALRLADALQVSIEDLFWLTDKSK